MVRCAAAATVVALAASCGGDGSDESATGSTSTEPPEATTTTPPTTVLSPEEEAEAVYLELVDTVERVLAQAPDPDNADLQRLAVDPVLGTLRDSLTTRQAEHHIGLLGDRTSHRIMSVSLERPDMALVRDCHVANDKVVDDDDGSIVDDGRLRTRVLEATVVRAAGRWAVSDIGTLERWDGEVPCPA
jgi:hypothetical protein